MLKMQCLKRSRLFSLSDMMQAQEVEKAKSNQPKLPNNIDGRPPSALTTSTKHTTSTEPTETTKETQEDMGNSLGAEEEVLESNNYTEYNFEMVSTYLPAPIAEYIIERFCADMDLETYKKIDFEKPCEDCIQTQRRMIKRQYLERTLVNKCELAQEGPFFVMPCDWLLKWKLYLFHDTEDDKFMKKYFFDSFELPKKIINRNLFAVEDEEEGNNLKDVTKSTPMKEGLEQVGL